MSASHASTAALLWALLAPAFPSAQESVTAQATPAVSVREQGSDAPVPRASVIVQSWTGAVHGRVVSESGRPLAKVRVELLTERARKSAPYRVFRVMRTADTDEGGRYRLPQLPAGEYFLRMNFGDGFSSPLNDVYYPGVGESATALPIEVHDAQELALTLTARAFRIGSISGRLVRSSTGRDLDLQVTMQRVDEDTGHFVVGHRVDVESDGSFSQSGLKSGVYGVIATAKTPSGTGRLREAAVVTVALGPGPLREVAMQLQACGTLSGTIVEADDATSGLGFVTVDVWPTANAWYLRSGLHDREATFTTGPFSVTGILGEHRVTVYANAGWIPKAMLLEDGRDILDQPIDFAGRNYSNVRVVMTDRAATVTVTDGAPPGPENYSITVFPEDRSRWYQESRFVKSGTRDADGSFTIRGVPPGETYLVATQPWPGGATPEMLAALARSAARVRIDGPGTYNVKLSPTR